MSEKLKKAIAEVENEPDPPCLNCVWATVLGERAKRSAAWVYCPFGSSKCLFNIGGRK